MSTTTETGKLTVEQLRRKASAAKSLLSRYQNDLENYIRSSKCDMDEHYRLLNRVKEQEQVFRSAVNAWRQSQ